MKLIIVIPARFASTRLPGKPLIPINGKSILYRTYERCIKVLDSSRVFVATDDYRIAEHCKQFGMNYKMTSTNCLTGTDRVAEFASMVDADVYVNVQGDEPIINPSDIEKIIQEAISYPDKIINGYTKITTKKDYYNPNIPKVVFSSDEHLLYMSRAPIPGRKLGGFVTAWRQVCVYAFPKSALFKFSNSDSKTPLEALEDIEILRFLELGMDVKMLKLSSESYAVDTPQDLEIIQNLLSKTDE